MLFEYQKGELWDATALTAGTVYSEPIDLGAVRQSMGAGGDLWLSLTVNVAESGTTNDTYVFTWQENTLEADTGGTVVDVFSISLTTADSGRLGTAGNIIWCGTIPYYTGQLQFGRWKAVLGNVSGTAGITVDANYSPARPATDRNARIFTSNVVAP